MNNFIRQYRILIATITIPLFIYICIRAYLISFSHDESLTFKILSGETYWKDTANNHLLNTLLMSISRKFWGISEFALRLPNVLSFLLYALACFLVFKDSKNIMISSLGLILALFNPFFIEFFSIARGYGLSMGFLLLSIYFLIRNSENNVQTKENLPIDFFLSAFFAGFAVYANLVMINYYISLLLLFSLRYLITKNIQTNSKNFNLKFLSAFLFSIIPLLLGLKRLFKLKELNQLYFGTETIMEGVGTLLSYSTFESSYSAISIILFEGLIILFLAISILYIFIKRSFNGPLFYITSVFCAIIVGLLLEHFLFQSKFPKTRGATFYIPLISVITYHLFLTLHHNFKIKKFLYVVVGAIAIPLLLNFAAIANFKYFTNWKYDAHNKSVMTAIKEQTQNSNNTFVISNTWLLEPAINYYAKRWKLNLAPANRDGINYNSDFVYRLDEKTPVDSFEVLLNYDDIKCDLLIKKRLLK